MFGTASHVEIWVNTLKSDILFLADVFKMFCNTCFKTYNLDPAHYYTLPGYTRDAMLKHTGIQLELLMDLDMFLFVERCIHGVWSQVCGKREAKANNEYINNYDPYKPHTF